MHAALLIGGNRHSSGICIKGGRDLAGLMFGFEDRFASGFATDQLRHHPGYDRISGLTPPIRVTNITAMIGKSRPKRSGSLDPRAGIEAFLTERGGWMVWGGTLRLACYPSILPARLLRSISLMS